uniref:Cytochrome P450 n=1 Tax=Leersia perrieri TaxID=77586 RepID=A0A0D9W8F5_9ORYZ
MEPPLSHPAMIALSLLLVALYLASRGLLGGKKRKKYPPVAGTVLHQLLNFGRFVEYQTELSRRHRTFRMLTPTCNYVYTVEPANVEHILKTNFANYGKGPMTHAVMEDLLGDGIFNVDGAMWRQQRKVASLEFSTRVLRDYSSAVFRDTAAELAGIILGAAAEEGERVDLHDLLMRSTLDSFFKVGFGVNLGVLSGSTKEGAAFARAFDDASEQVLYRFFDLLWKVKRFLNVSSEAAMKKSVRTINDFVYAVIDRKIEQMSREQHEFAKKEDILSRFLLERERDLGCFDNKYLRDIILNFVIAGRDTTSGTLSWFFYMLCKNPRVQEKVAQEVRNATTGDDDVGVQDFPAFLTEDAINKMQYLHAALTETLRLYPGVPIDVKYCFSDDTLPDGHAVNKGDMVNYQPYPMGRMKFLWGNDAEEFRPERWLDDAGVFVPESNFKFTAFQAGPRICLGKEFAYRQMKIVSAVLVYFFRFEMWDIDSTVGYRPMLTLKMDGPLYLRAFCPVKLHAISKLKTLSSTFGGDSDGWV